MQLLVAGHFNDKEYVDFPPNIMLPTSETEGLTSHNVDNLSERRAKAMDCVALQHSVALVRHSCDDQSI